MIAATPTTATGVGWSSFMAGSFGASCVDAFVEDVGDGVHVGEQPGLGRSHRFQGETGDKLTGGTGVSGAGDPPHAFLGDLERGLAGEDTADRGQPGGVEPS